MNSDLYQSKRLEMVHHQLQNRDILDPKMIQVFREVPRHEFMEPASRYLAYEDYPVSIGEAQTISQPYIVALMTQSLQLTGNEKILEIGTGSGYQTAILSRLCKKVVTIERLESLSKKAQTALKNYSNIRFVIGDGSLGFPQEAPYQGILVTAGAPKVPTELEQQLAEGGRIIIPTGTLDLQDLLIGIKKSGTITYSSMGGCRFVPLLGQSGWKKP
ncbi:MAG: protein-L-isoaspartate(D-aspartate) O-methyltransferase [Planctomycetota bacterium]